MVEPEAGVGDLVRCARIEHKNRLGRRRIGLFADPVLGIS